MSTPNPMEQFYRSDLAGALREHRRGLSPKVHGNTITLMRLAGDEIDKLNAEVASLRAERARYRAALADLCDWFPEKPSPPEWRLAAGKYGADDAIAAARAALTPTEDRNG